MTSNKKILNLLLLIILLVNLFSFSWSIRDDKVIKKNVKGRLGTHWYRIGKRFELDSEEQNESKLENTLSTDKNICDVLLRLKQFPYKSYLWMLLEHFLGKFFL